MTAIIIIGVAIYFLPTLSAAGNGHVNAPAIFMLNLLLGWTLVGWVVALVWSLTSGAPAARYQASIPAPGREDAIPCQKCGTPIHRVARKCPYCMSRQTKFVDVAAFVVIVLGAIIYFETPKTDAAKASVAETDNFTHAAAAPDAPLEPVAEPIRRDAPSPEATASTVPETIVRQEGTIITPALEDRPLPPPEKPAPPPPDYDPSVSNGE